MTPPALYRHFANKYAVMEELGRRLMEAQNDALYALLVDEAAVVMSPDAITMVLIGQYELTTARLGARWIIRSLHSTPALTHMRPESHAMVGDYLARRHFAAAPGDA